MSSLETAAADIVRSWDWSGPVGLRRVPEGLINATFTVEVEGRFEAVLQRLNTAVFGPEVNQDIEAVTARLAERGVLTPRLLRTRRDALWASTADGDVWRCLTAVGERTLDSLSSPLQARSAGQLAARFHVALADLEWEFRSVRPGFQDTARHLANLGQALAEHGQHRLFPAVARLADVLAVARQGWSGVAALPPRVVHGDLKVSNLRFAGSEAMALIDLDTLARGTIDAELGDALRSWCNPAGENVAEVALDLELFEAAVGGYASGGGRELLTEAEWASLVPGLERISLNLSARFAADALQERYFGWDPARGGRGEHNLLRARGQASLLGSIRRQRRQLEAALRRARTSVPTPP